MQSPSHHSHSALHDRGCITAVPFEAPSDRSAVIPCSLVSQFSLSPASKPAHRRSHVPPSPPCSTPRSTSRNITRRPECSHSIASIMKSGHPCQMNISQKVSRATTRC